MSSPPPSFDSISTHSTPSCIFNLRENRTSLQLFSNLDIARLFFYLNPIPVTAQGVSVWYSKHQDRMKHCMCLYVNEPYNRKLQLLKKLNLPPALLSEICRIAKKQALLFYTNKLDAVQKPSGSKVDSIFQFLIKNLHTYQEEQILEEFTESIPVFTLNSIAYQIMAHTHPVVRTGS